MFQEKSPTPFPVLPTTSRRPSASRSNILEYKGIQDKNGNSGEEGIGDEEEEEEEEGSGSEKYLRDRTDLWTPRQQDDKREISDVKGRREGNEVADGEGSSVSSSQSQSTAVSASSAGALARNSNARVRRNGSDSSRSSGEDEDNEEADEEDGDEEEADEEDGDEEEAEEEDGDEEEAEEEDQFDFTSTLNGFNEHIDSRRRLYDKNRNRVESSDGDDGLKYSIPSSLNSNSHSQFHSSQSHLSPLRSAALPSKKSWNDVKSGSRVPTPQVLLRVQLDLR